MKMLKITAFAALAAGTSLLTGCAGWSITHPGGEGNTTPCGVSPGTLIGDVTYPNYVQSITRFELNSGDFSIIGPVSAEATSASVLGLISTGDNGYHKLFAAAQRIGADDVINIKVDTNLKRFLTGVYASSTVKMSGIAIKYKRSK